MRKPNKLPASTTSGNAAEELEGELELELAVPLAVELSTRLLQLTLDGIVALLDNVKSAH